MSSQQIVDLAISAGCDVVDYGDHYCIKRVVEVTVVVTLPNVSNLATLLVEKIKALLNLD